MDVITVALPPYQLKVIEVMVAFGRYASRSEIIRIAIRDFFMKEIPAMIAEETIADNTIVKKKKYLVERKIEFPVGAKKELFELLSNMLEIYCSGNHEQG